MICDTKPYGQKKVRRGWIKQSFLILAISLNYLIIIILNGLVIYWIYFDQPMQAYFTTTSEATGELRNYVFLSLKFYVLSGLLHLFSILHFWSFNMTLTDPGYFKNSDFKIPLLDTPTEYKNEIAGLRGLERERYEKWTKKRYCFDWDWVKPPRTHHWSICNRCVLRMDHHWNWISNWVGHKNHKFFLLFLIYYVLSFWMFYSISIQVIIADFQYSYLVINIILVFILLHILRVFVRQLRLVPYNLSSIEGWVVNKSPFDFGLMHNLKSTFGKNILLWPVPVRQSLPYNGFSFAVNVNKLM